MALATFLNGRPPTRGLLWLALSDEAIMEKHHVTSDAGGGGSVTWTAAGTVPCRIAPLSRRPEERLTAGQIDERSTHVIETLPETEAIAGNRVVVVGRGTFEVLGVRRRTGELAKVFEVIELL